MAKLIASMRCWYSFLSMALCERPIVWLDLTPRPASNGSMKLSKSMKKRVGAAHDRAHVVVDESREHDRLAAVAAFALDAREALLGFFRRIDEGQGDLVELHAFELRQQAVAEHLRRDAGAVGDEEHGSAFAHTA